MRTFSLTLAVLALAASVGLCAEPTAKFQLAVAAYSYRSFTFFEAVDHVRALGVSNIEGFDFQRISGEIPSRLDPAQMTDAEMASVQKKLADSGVTLLALYYSHFPNDEAACRRIFARSKALGVRYFVSEPSPAVLPLLDKLGAEYGVTVGLHGHGRVSSPHTWHPEKVLELCSEYSPAISAFSDTGHWIRSGLNPADGAAILRDRMVGVEIHDTDAQGRDVPLGTGVGNMAEFLKILAESQREGAPTLLSIEYTTNPQDPTDDLRQCIEFLRANCPGL